MRRFITCRPTTAQPPPALTLTRSFEHNASTQTLGPAISTALPNWSHERILHALQRNSFCTDLSAVALDTLLAEGRILATAPSVLIYQKGEPAHGLFLVLEGSVVLAPTATPQPGDANLTEVPAGTFFGERAVLENRLRPNFAVARASTALLSISVALLTELLANHGLLIARNLTFEVRQSLRRNNSETVANLLHEQRTETLRVTTRALYEHGANSMTLAALLGDLLAQHLQTHPARPLAQRLQHGLSELTDLFHELQAYAHETTQPVPTRCDLRTWWADQADGLLLLVEPFQLQIDAYLESHLFTTDFDLLGRILRRWLMTISRVTPAHETLTLPGGLYLEQTIRIDLTYRHPDITDLQLLCLFDPFLPLAKNQNTWIDLARSQQLARTLGGTATTAGRSGDRVTLRLDLPLDAFRSAAA